MKIFIGADHRGFDLKNKIIRMLNGSGHNIVDSGVYDNAENCDYPLIACKVAGQVVRARSGGRGILICMSGIGQSIAANKVQGAYAALCYNVTAAVLSRKHNNSNILVLGSETVKQGEAMKIVDIWLNTKFEGGRHLRRFNQIRKIEKGELCDF